MSDELEGECLECGEHTVIGNPGWIAGITGLDRKDILYCEDCMGVMLEDVTIDLVGVQHTRDEAFQEADSGFEKFISK